MKRLICDPRMLSIAIASLCFFASNAAAEPRDSEVSRADQLANAIFFEGVPFEEASDFSDADVERLIELLDDPSRLRLKKAPS